MKITSKDIINNLVGLGIISKVGKGLYSTDLFSKLPELIEIYRKSNKDTVEEKIKEVKELDFKSKKLTLNDLYSTEFEEWVTSWNEKFPSAKKAKELSGIERNYRGGLSGSYGVKAKMIEYLIGIDFKYNLNVIDVATDLYIYREYENSNLKYLKQSNNFIHKQDEGSKLESECQTLMEELKNKGIIQEELHLYINNEDGIDNQDINKSIDTNDDWTFIHA